MTGHVKDIPKGARLFVDANILVHHFIVISSYQDRSQCCSQRLQRIEQGGIAGFCSTAIVAEAVHKVMMTEAVVSLSRSPKGLPHRLQEKPAQMAQLTAYLSVAEKIRAIGVSVYSISTEDIIAAAVISNQYHLLTNDSITIAVMQKLSLTDLATNDDNFDRIPWLNIWKPR